MVRTVKTEKGEISYELNRKSVKNMNLRVKKDGTVSLSIPYFVAYKQADDFVAKNADFIFSALEKVSAKTEKDPYTTFYLGERLKIAALTSSKKGGELIGGCLLLYLPKGYSQQELDNALRFWQKKQAAGVFKDALDNAYGRFAEKGLKIPYPDLTVRSMTSRWGSCTAARNKVTLNLQLIEKPFDCIEYVACHELAHFLVQNHSEKFYRVLDTVLPQHREIKRALNKQQ
ncbi:MAG: M48 family metallopeptidase [[Eubacterium] siraeum]|nr:M48 family metallopeptidase [[Eubacterium] siraeum]